MNNEVIHVALAFDECYALHASTTIVSILMNAEPTDRHCIHILDTGISVQTKERIKVLASPTNEITFHEVPLAFLHGFPTTNHAASTYARLALPLILPDCKRVLYIDSDLIVLDSLSALWREDIGSFAIGAAPDTMHYFRGCALEYWERIGIPNSAIYFSAGVLLMNLDLWREQEILNELLRWCSRNASLMQHSDQSALNAVLHNRVRLLNLRWNVQTPLFPPVMYSWGGSKELFRAVQKPSIVHYSTHRKPWKMQYKVPMSNQYWNYRKKLGWPEKPAPLSATQKIQRTQEELLHLSRICRAMLRKVIKGAPRQID